MPRHLLFIHVFIIKWLFCWQLTDCKEVHGYLYRQIIFLILLVTDTHKKHWSASYYYVLSTSLGKTVFAWCFILKENILFWSIISYQKQFVFFCFCVLFSNIYPKIKFMAKNWSDLCNFYSKVIFLEFLSEKVFFNFLCWIRIIDISQQYCENFRKIEQA